MGKIKKTKKGGKRKYDKFHKKYSHEGIKRNSGRKQKKEGVVNFENNSVKAKKSTEYVNKQIK